MSKPQRSTDSEVAAAAARMPAEGAWAIVAYFGRKSGQESPRRTIVASAAPRAVNLPRQIALDMPDTFETCTLVGWSAGVDPGELGF